MSRANRALDVKKKNRRKVIRTIFQIIILACLIWVLVQTLFTIRTYEEPVRSTWHSRGGFIALTYFGVGRNGTSTFIDDDRLMEQLETLKNLGFVTVSQQDLIDFYEKGSPLPDRALFLAFEDGRNDSALYAQGILEKLNYRATMMTYADKMIRHERKFLRPKQLQNMADSGYWEIGSNGNRFTYINIHTESGDFYGMLEDIEFDQLRGVTSYNHYLMDLLRDRRMIPVENRDEMFARINSDYAALAGQYRKAFGYVPHVYMIMHANALYGGINPLVEEANDGNIRRLFDLHFNREGAAYNSPDDDPYNLTRLQVPPYWYTNHLLMKLRLDTGMDLPFVTGDERRAERWEPASGALQFLDERMVLTSPPYDHGVAVLKGSGGYTDVELDVELSGNVVGEHGLLLRYDRTRQSYVRVAIRDLRLIVEEKLPGEPVTLLADEPIGSLAPVSDGGDAADTENAANHAVTARTGASYPVSLAQKIRLSVAVKGNTLSVAVDGKKLADEIVIRAERGAVALTSRRSEHNVKDPIFDAVFDRLVITRTDVDPHEVVYRDRLEGLSLWLHRAKKWTDAVIDWAIEQF
jgi:hypothetical protein